MQRRGRWQSDVWNVTAGSATGGSFTLNVDGLLTGPIPWNASPLMSKLRSWQPGLPPRSPAPVHRDPWVITFAAAPVVTPDLAGVTPWVYLTRPRSITAADT